MNQQVTLFMGQWADLPRAEVVSLPHGWRHDGLEIAGAVEHFDVHLSGHDSSYLKNRIELLKRNELSVFAISNHLTDQAVCDDPIDSRHRSILGAAFWGDGEAAGVRQRSAEELKLTAIAARKLGVDTVVGYSGSKIWRSLANFPSVSEVAIDAGYQDSANRWNPTLDLFKGEGVGFVLEVHPSEIASDYSTLLQALEAVDHRWSFGFNWGASHKMCQGLDPAGFMNEFSDRMFHANSKEPRLRLANGRRKVLGSHLAWGDPRRRWDFPTAGRGYMPWEDCFRVLRTTGYDSTIAVEWEDSGLDWLVGAAETVTFIRPLLWDLPSASLDSAFAAK